MNNASIQNRRQTPARQTVPLGTPITDGACGLIGGVATNFGPVNPPPAEGLRRSPARGTLRLVIWQ